MTSPGRKISRAEVERKKQEYNMAVVRCAKSLKVHETVIRSMLRGRKIAVRYIPDGYIVDALTDGGCVFLTDRAVATSHKGEYQND